MNIDFRFELMGCSTFELNVSLAGYNTLEFIRKLSASSNVRQQTGATNFFIGRLPVLRDRWSEPNKKQEIHLPFFVKAGTSVGKCIFFQ